MNDSKFLSMDSGEGDDGYCPARDDDGIHCIHWWDAEPCCTCGAGRDCIESHSCSHDCDTEMPDLSCCYMGACDCCQKAIVDGVEGMACRCAAEDCSCIHGFAAENYD